MKKSLLLSVLWIIVTALTILTASIAVPTTWKGFYYHQIDSLKIRETTGLSLEEIKTAYSEMVDYCNGIQKEFSVGNLSWSESGKDHFSDCRRLFLLDYTVLGICVGLLLLWVILRRFVPARAKRLGNHAPCFWGALLLLTAFVIIGGLAALDFDRAFVIFHSLFFPGKSNWLFDPRVDQVITILPETFFMNCGILIVGLILTSCTVIVIGDLISHRRRGKHSSTRSYQCNR